MLRPARRAISSTRDDLARRGSAVSSPSSTPERTQGRAPIGSPDGRRQPSYDVPQLRLDHIVRMTDYTASSSTQRSTCRITTRAIAPMTTRGFHSATVDELGGRVPSESLIVGYDLPAFLSAALNRETGRFRNFMSYGRQWLEYSGSEDSCASPLGCGHRCEPLAQRGPPEVVHPTLRARLAAVEAFPRLALGFHAAGPP